MYFSGGEGVRYEQLPGEWFDYNNAFPTVTGFYSSSPPGLMETPTTEPSSLNMDTTKMAEGYTSNACILCVYEIYLLIQSYISCVYYTCIHVCT